MMNGQRNKIVLILIFTIVIIGMSFHSYQQKSKVNDVPANVQVSGNTVTEQKGSVVYISGAIKQPGVVEAPDGSRIIDIINMAGGLAQGADVGNINLAQPVKDGMHIKIPQAGLATGVEQKAADSQSVKININTAGKTELDKLPGIGPALAERIIEYRQTNGLFNDIAEIKKVKGISDSKYNKLKDKITI